MKLECINRVELRGIVGVSKIKEIGNKKQINFSLATNYISKDKNNCSFIETTWHSCTVFVNQDDDLSIFDKGTPLHIEGRIRNLCYSDYHGCERTTTEIIVSKILKVETNQATEMIRKGTKLLTEEIITMVNSGQEMCTDDSVYGYVINTEDDSMMEVDVKYLAVVNDELYAFMTKTDDIDYSKEEAMKMLQEPKDDFLPSWFVLDEGLYGLVLPTLLNIHDAMTYK